MLPAESRRAKYARSAVGLLLSGAALVLVYWWILDWLGPSADRRMSWDNLRYGHLRYRLRDVDVSPLALAGELPIVGSGVYLEEIDLQGTWRLRKIGEVVYSDTQRVRLALHPAESVKLQGVPLEVTCYQFDTDFDKLGELVLSRNRWRAVREDLTKLWESTGGEVKGELRELLNGTMQAIDPAKKEAIEGVAVQEVVAGWIDQERPAPAAAKDKAFEAFAGEFLSKLFSDERLSLLTEALKRIWSHVRSVGLDAGSGQGTTWVGVQDILERYLFLSEGTPPERKLTAFSPEVTILLRGILYAPTRTSSGRESAPPERWIVLRRPSTPGLQLSDKPAGALWSVPPRPVAPLESNQ